MKTPTIREYCEKHRPHDDLESLYFVLECHFGGLKPDDPLPPDMKKFLDEL